MAGRIYRAAPPPPLKKQAKCQHPARVHEIRARERGAGRPPSGWGAYGPQRVAGRSTVLANPARVVSQAPGLSITLQLVKIRLARGFLAALFDQVLGELGRRRRFARTLK